MVFSERRYGVKAAFYTLGCKVNQYETQAMMKQMAAAGYEVEEHAGGAADVLVINSCTVTGESDRKLRQLLRRLRREHPAAVIVLTGCMPQAFPDKAAELVDADIVLGNAQRSAVAAHVEAFLVRHERLVDIPHHAAAYERLSVDDFQGRTRAFVKIEDGCNRFCSYCIIPYARGRVRSRPLEELREEAAALAGRGFREVVLVGINLTAYGQDTGADIADAVNAAAEPAGIRRVRLGSLEPDHLTDALIARLAAQPKLCPQFHISLQSGCDATLRRMNRHYSSAQYADLCARLRAAFPGCALTTDVMVGFPGEDEDEFAQSLAFVQAVGFAKVHIFAYSRRPGTPAAAAPGQVTAAEKSVRSRRMAAVCGISRDAYIADKCGTLAEVLLETRGEDGRLEGYTPDYLPVFVEADAGEPGELITVRLTAPHGDGCLGEAVR